MQKRILKAKKLIEDECPITKAYLLCSFTDYSNFLRAYKKYLMHLLEIILLEVKNELYNLRFRI